MPCTPETLASLFDSICFEHGDKDSISFHDNEQSMCYFELQQASQALAAQLHYRFRPTYVLLDLRGHAAAEAVSILACNRIGIMFVPVQVEIYNFSCKRQYRHCDNMLQHEIMFKLLP